MLHAAAVLSGSVYFDSDGDGARGPGEAGVPGVVIQLSPSNSSDASMDRSTMTDNNGLFTFDELEEGSYDISKRESPATTPAAAPVENMIEDVVLADDEHLDGIDFSEGGLRSEFISIAWFFASAPPAQQMLREMMALSEELAGNEDLAASIRAGGGDVPDGANNAPSATNDLFTVEENGVLTIGAASGVLANDVDLDGDSLTAARVGQASNGVASLNNDGSFTYTPDPNFSGTDSFTYRANDGQATSNLATVRINVTPVDNQLFGPVTPGPFDAPGLLGIRTDLVSGAPPITNAHQDGDIDYTGYSNPPTYGDHHGFDPNDTDVNPGITPRPTGVYVTGQSEEDLIHNLEHGHVWISYNPDLISEADRQALERLVLDGSPNPNGSGVGVILTPRAANDSLIALASWAHLLTLDEFDAATIRNFVETNRGKAPEGFITP